MRSIFVKNNLISGERNPYILSVIKKGICMKVLKVGMGFWLGCLAASGMLTGCLTNSSDSGSGAPTISAQPHNATVSVGATATFTVTATGAATLTYQWMNGTANVVNGNGITGATTNTLTIAGVAASDGGASFKCVVTNSAGSVTSSAATLLVNVPVTSLSLTAGAQGNANNGSFLDIDNMTDYLSGEVTTNASSADIDLFFGYSTTSNAAAIYSPDIAAGANGFTVAQNTLTTANTTHIRSVTATFASITNQSQIDSLWTTVSDVANGKLVINNGDTFIAESNLGLLVLIQVSAVVQSANGTVTLTGKSKF
jgi:hypothetical protein